jgi:hypothetical protein
MLSETEFRPRVREARVYGFEMKYGYKDLEETVERKEGLRRLEILEPEQKVGLAFMQAQKRMNAGNRKRLLISAWLSFPIILADPSDTSESLWANKERLLKAHRVLRRFIFTKANQYLRSLPNGT